MAATWESVVSNPQYQALPPAQQEAARQQYFDSVVAPNVPKDHLDFARQQFDNFSATKTQSAPSFSNNMIRDINNEIMRPNASGIGIAAGVVSDLGKEATSRIPGVKQVGSAIQSADEAGQQFVQPLANAISPYTDKPIAAVSDYIDQSPGLKGALGDMKNIAGAGATLSAVDSLRSTLGDIGESAAQQLARPEGRFPKAEAPPAIPSSAVKSASQNAYKYAENVGGVLNPDNFTNNILDIIDEAKAKPIAGKVLTAEQRALNGALDEYSPLRDSPLTIDDFENLDKSLGAKESTAMDGFKSTNNSRIIGQVQDKIRDRLQNLKEGDVIGGKEGFDALTQHAVPLWSTQAKMSDLEAIIERANSMDNPTTAMRTGFRNLANSPRINGYPPEVQDLIRKAATNPSDILGIVGSRLNPIVSDTTAGKAVNMVTSKAFRGIRNKMQQAKADKILSAMTDPVRSSVEKFSTLPESPYLFKPEVPTEAINPYLNPNAVTLKSFHPNTDVPNLGPEVPTEDNIPGSASTYYKKGGPVKKPRNLTAEFLGRKYA